jgi:hypothetical protein
MNTRPQPTHPTWRPWSALLTASLGLFFLSAAGCPARDAGAPPAPTPDAAPAPAPASAPADAHKGGEPAPGSKKVAPFGPPAPAIFFLSGLKGYTEPCGCTLDILLGGIDRIAGTLHEARAQALASLVLDAGDTLFDLPALEPYRVPQEKDKADVIVQALVEMGVSSTTPGPNDLALGRHFYLDKVRAAGIEILVGNLKEASGLPLGAPHQLHDLGGLKVGVLGLVQPDLFVGIEGLTVSDPVPAAQESVKALQQQGAQVIVAVFHGDLKHTKELLRAVPAISFAVVGHEPRNTDQVDLVEGNYTLEAYDQGRYLGELRLYHNGPPAPGGWANANNAPRAEIERVEARMTQVQDQINRIPPATPGQEPPFLLRLRQQLDELKAERHKLAQSTLDVPKDRAAFAWRTLAIEPGYPLHAPLTQAREGYNQRLKAITEANPDPIEPVADGQPEYIGAERCATCHPDATRTWQETAHARAIQTLIDRDKNFDKSCVGCHVTGYRKPGGAVAGKLQYEVTLNGETFTKKLENVGCEVCHGPGSLHAAAPLGADSKPQHIQRAVPVELCQQCHNSEHSPRFNNDTYRPRILGEGHQAR